MSGVGKPGVRVAAWAHASEAPEDLEDAFPGRWDPRRALDAPLRPLIHALRSALAQADWRVPDEDAALVVAVDHHVAPAAARFASALASGRGLRPAPFLCSLPSTAATTASVLFGLGGYQATLNTEGLGGIQALTHAYDLLAFARCERVVVAALSAHEEWTCAVVALLEPGDQALEWGRGEHPGAAHSHERLAGVEVPTPARALAAPGLLSALQAGAQGVVHTAPLWAQSLWVRWPAGSVDDDSASNG